VNYTIELLASCGDPAIIGRKAASLVELQQAGFAVPRAVCVTTAAFRDWQGSGSLTAELRDALIAAFGSLRAPLAVRSSSPAEDLADASFAGQYATILGVRTEQHLLEAVQACWHSASSAAAHSYRRARGTDLVVDMAVLIQELVPADAAGVMFTLNPVTDRADELVVNANFGLGESVVSGRAEPDTFVLDKATGAKRETRLGSKRVFTNATSKGVQEEALDEARQHTACLSDAQLQCLVATANRLEAHYDAPMDCEWAFVGTALHLLQARPVTTGFAAYHAYLLDQWARNRGLRDDPGERWVRGSVLSGLRVSPLYYSEMSPFFADMFVRIAALHGAPPLRQKVFSYFRGFTYTDAEFSSTADPPGNIKIESPFGPAWKSNLRIALRHPFSLAFWTNIDYYDRMWNRRWWPAVEAQRPDMATADPAAIRDFIEFIEVQRRERSVVAGLAVGYAPNFLGLLAWLLQRWVPAAPADTLGILTSGLPDSLTHDENVALWKLAQSAASLPHVRAALLSGAFDTLAAQEGGAQFLTETDAFRKRHAHRGCSDRDIFQPRWGDDRQLLLNQLAMVLNLGSQADPREAHARAESKRLARERDIFAALGRGPLAFLRRRVLRSVLRTTQRYVMHRDNQRHTFEPYFLELRRAYQAIGDRLVTRGLLARRDDVFFLGKHEVYAYIDGTLPGARLSSRARWRREWWNKVTREEPPTHLLGYRPWDPGTPEAGEADLVGAPGAPGTATGPVRLISSLQELNRIRAGDIVVTYAIDPAWTPVFGIIAGVISVEGGMLAHAAVLGREYGLPVVLGVREATVRLKEGDIVRIDGTAGTVIYVGKVGDAAHDVAPEVASVSHE
jgi:phosphohistidine swiveling domain-containing protein